MKNKTQDFIAEWLKQQNLTDEECVVLAARLMRLDFDEIAFVVLREKFTADQVKKLEVSGLGKLK